MLDWLVNMMRSLFPPRSEVCTPPADKCDTCGSTAPGPRAKLQQPDGPDKVECLDCGARHARPKMNAYFPENPVCCLCNQPLGNAWVAIKDDCSQCFECYQGKGN